MTAGLILSDLFGFVVSIQFFATPLKREFLCFSPILFTNVAKTVKAKHNVDFIRQELCSANVLSYTEGSRLMRTSLLRFFKTFHKYLPYANFGLFSSLMQFIGQNIRLM